MARAVAVEPVKATPATSGWATSAAPERAVARHQMQGRTGMPASCSSRDRDGGDQRRLRRRLGDDAVAGDERGRDLAGEDREREVPRRDAEEDAAPAQDQPVLLAGRAGQRGRRGEFRLGLGGVVAAEIDRLAQFGDGVVERLAGLGLQQGQQQAAALLHQIGGLAQGGGAAAGRRGVPGGEAAWAARRRRSASAASASRTVADRLAVDRRQHRARRAAGSLAVDDRAGFREGLGGAAAISRQQRLEALGMAEFDAGRVLARRADRDRPAAGCARCRAAPAWPMMSAGGTSRSRDRHVGIAGDADEGGVGAVLEQAADEIGEQVLMAADRRIGPAGIAGAARPAASRRAPRPCRAGAGTRSPRRRRPSRRRSRPSAHCAWRIAG